MSAADEVLAINRAISSIDAETARLKSSILIQEKAIAKTGDKIEEKRLQLNICNANLKHMRNVADHVVLQEWVATKDLRIAAQLDLAEAQERLAKEQNGLRQCADKIEYLAQTRAGLTASLKDYGQLRTFPRK